MWGKGRDCVWERGGTVCVRGEGLCVREGRGCVGEGRGCVCGGERLCVCGGGGVLDPVLPQIVMVVMVDEPISHVARSTFYPLVIAGRTKNTPNYYLTTPTSDSIIHRCLSSPAIGMIPARGISKQHL